MIQNLKGPEVSFVDMLHHTLMEQGLKSEQQLKDGKAEKGPFRPSSAGECERALAFKGMEFTGQAYYEKKPIDPHVHLIFRLGHAVEAMLIQAFKEVEFFETKYLQQTLSFFKINSGDSRIDMILEGSNDGCFVAKTGEYKGVFDIKSKGMGTGKYKKTKWDEFDCELREMKSVQVISETGYWIEDVEAFIREANDPHLAMNFWQLNLYCNSDFMKERGFDFASLIYFGKDSSAMRELRFKPSEKLAKLTEVRFQNAAKAVKEGNPLLAKQEFLLGSSKCAFCPYVSTCYGINEQAALKEHFKQAYGEKTKWPKNLDKDDSEIASKFKLLHSTEKSLKDRVNLEDELKLYMVQNDLDKVQFVNNGEKIIYECKKLKTTVQLRRAKL